MPKNYIPTPFMDELSAKMVEYGLAETSRLHYLRNIEILNNEKPIDNLQFLLDDEEMERKMAHLKPNSKRVYYTSIHSALKLTYPMPDEDIDVKIDLYHERLLSVARSIDKTKNKKTKVQEDNWVDWADIIDEWESMNDCFSKIKAIGSVTQDYQYTFLLHFVILTLYVKMLPRRNMDYLDMVISKKRPEVLANGTNYLILDEKKFVFQKFKTFKHFGTQEVDIPDDVMEILWFYINQRKTDGGIPTLGLDLKKGKTFPFLLYVNGGGFIKGNAITRCLNRIFAPKRIGCAMLRTIYATDTLLAEQEKNKIIAEGMGHSVSTQQNIYIKH